MKHGRAAKTIIGLIASLFCLLPARQVLAQAAPAPAAQYQPLAPDQLDNLTAPVALYPDALLSEILVAATYPLDVVQASQWIAAGNDPAAIGSQPWDASVKGLANYPGLLAKLASDAAWLNDLGAAFLNQQPDVMSSVQRLRAQAIAAGTLYSGPQQQVIQDGSIIEIIPSDPNTIFAPVYDPSVVYEAPDLPPGTVIVPLITFGDGCAVGLWLGYDWDWYDNQLYFGSWGPNRPWWNWHDRDHLHYDQYRPGHYTAPAGTNWKPAQWTRNRARPAPSFHPLPAQNVPRHPLGGGPSAALPEYDRGAQAERDAQRAQSERQRATPAPARQPTPEREPAREAPAPQAPVREEPAREAPVWEAPQQAPAREAPPEREAPRDSGGAMDYGGGDDAARASERGGESRGGGEAGGGGGGASRGGGGGGGGRR
jgi:hypothetical protein